MALCVFGISASFLTFNHAISITMARPEMALTLKKSFDQWLPAFSS